MKIGLCFTIILLTNKTKNMTMLRLFAGEEMDKWDEVVFLTEVKEVDLKNKT